MSDGHTNETRELNLDAIAEWFEGKAENPDTLQDVSEWHAVRDLVAEVRTLRETCIPVPEGLDRDKAAGILWLAACAPLQWVTGPYPDDWPLEGKSLDHEWPDEDELDTHETEALREFQRANGLMVDGILGPQTWSALRARNESHPYA